VEVKHDIVVDLKGLPGRALCGQSPGRGTGRPKPSCSYCPTRCSRLGSSALPCLPARSRRQPRVDRENRPSYGCFHAAIALGPVPSGSGQPVYAVIQDDSLAGIVTKRSDIIFQRSTDQGATWLGQDIIIKRGEMFAGYPDITTDAEGAVFVVYTKGVNNTHKPRLLRAVYGRRDYVVNPGHG